MHKIACFGDNCVDYYDEEKLSFYGGNPVNVAVYTKRLGYDASYIGNVGTDEFGKGFIDALLKKGVDISHTHIVEGNTALTHVSVINGDRILGDYDEGVMADFLLSKDDIDFITGHDLCVTGLWGKCESQLSLLKEKGMEIAFDSADRPEDPVTLKVYPYVDIFFFSDDNSENIEEKMLEIFKRGPKLVIATRGEKGSVAYDGKEFVYQGIIELDIADTMGAGDSFIAGFLNAYLQKQSLKICMEEGALCSAETLKYHGAW